MKLKLLFVLSYILFSIATIGQGILPEHQKVLNGFRDDCKPTSIVWEYLSGEKNWELRLDENLLIKSIVGKNHRFDYEYHDISGAAKYLIVKSVSHYLNNVLVNKIEYKFVPSTYGFSDYNPASIPIEENYYTINTASKSLELSAQIKHFGKDNEKFDSSILFVNKVASKKVVYGKYRTEYKKDFTIIDLQKENAFVDYKVNRSRRKLSHNHYGVSSYSPIYFLVHYNNFFSNQYVPELTINAHSTDLIESFAKKDSKEAPTTTWNVETMKKCFLNFPIKFTENNAGKINEVNLIYDCKIDCSIKVNTMPPVINPPTKDNYPPKGNPETVNNDTIKVKPQSEYNPYSDCYFYEDFSSNNGWMNGAVVPTSLDIKNGKLLGRNIPGAYRDERLYKRLPREVGDNFQVSFDLVVNDFGASGGSYLPVVLTAENMPASNPDNNINVQTMQSAFGVLCMNYLNLSPNKKLWLEPYVKNYGTVQVMNESQKIEIEKYKYYKVIFKKNRNIGNLIVLDEYGSQVGFVKYEMQAGVRDFNYVQASNLVQASEDRRMSADVDNICISNFKEYTPVKITPPVKGENPNSPIKELTGYVRLIAFEDFNQNKKRDEGEFIVKIFSGTITNLDTRKITDYIVAPIKKRYDLPVGRYSFDAQYINKIVGRDGVTRQLTRRSVEKFTFEITANKETVADIYFRTLTLYEMEQYKIDITWKDN